MVYGVMGEKVSRTRPTERGIRHEVRRLRRLSGGALGAPSGSDGLIYDLITIVFEISKGPVGVRWPQTVSDFDGEALF